MVSRHSIETGPKVTGGGAGSKLVLRACHEALPWKTWEEAGVNRLGWDDFYQSMWYTLYDEATQRFV